VAKDKPKPAPPKAAEPKKPVPYPRTWGSMDRAARQEWMKVNRPDRPQNVAATPTRAAAPAPAPAPAPAAPSAPEAAGSKPLVQIDVSTYTVRVGTREPVPCDPAEVMQVIDDELDAWEEQCQNQGEDEDQEEEEES
jgi:hypothetical protein